MRTFGWAALVVFVSQLTLAQDRRSCYYPNGDLAPGDFPCDPSAEHSACCFGWTGTSCLNNNLCKGSDEKVIRGSCTDSNWDSPACPKYCFNRDNAGIDLIPCSNVTRTDTSFCCDGSVDCCDSGVGRFEVLPSKPSVTATFNARSGYQLVGVSTTRSTSVSKGTTSTLLTSTSESPTSTSAGTGAATTTSASSSPTAVPLQTESSPGLSTAAQAGIGVGAAVIALLLAAVVYLLWKLKKKNQGPPPGVNPVMYASEMPGSAVYSPTKWPVVEMDGRVMHYGRNNQDFHELPVPTAR